MTNYQMVLKRILAYIIDFIIVYVLTYSIVNSKINFQYDDFLNVYDNYSNSYTTFSGVVSDINSCMEDDEFTKEEYESFIERNPKYVSFVEKYYKDDKIAKDDFDTIVNNITDDYMSEYKQSFFDIAKYSTFQNAITFIVYILYFVLFAKFADGATLGKRLMKIKIVSLNNGKVSLLNYLIRSVILNGTLFIAINIAMVYLANINAFFVLNNIVSLTKALLFWVCVVMVVTKKNSRGLQDILAKTKVISTETGILDTNITEETKEKEEAKYIEVIPKEPAKIKKNGKSKDLIK